MVPKDSSQAPRETSKAITMTSITKEASKAKLAEVRGMLRHAVQHAHVKIPSRKWNALKCSNSFPHQLSSWSSAFQTRASWNLHKKNPWDPNTFENKTNLCLDPLSWLCSGSAEMSQQSQASINGIVTSWTVWINLRSMVFVQRCSEDHVSRYQARF